jgi:hypothetical protein
MVAANRTQRVQRKLQAEIRRRERTEMELRGSTRFQGIGHPMAIMHAPRTHLKSARLHRF